jgi:hypothetical protein
MAWTIFAELSYKASAAIMLNSNQNLLFSTSVCLAFDQDVTNMQENKSASVLLLHHRFLLKPRLRVLKLLLLSARNFNLLCLHP